MDKKTKTGGEKNMAEFETYVELDGEVDIDIDFSVYTYKEIITLLWKILRGQKVTFEEVYVEIGGDTNVEIEPQDRY